MSRGIAGLFVLGLWGLMWWFSSLYLLKIPPVWPDESLVADVAWNILHGNGAKTDLLPDLIAESERYGFGYPPGYLYALAGWFWWWGFGVESLRWFSLIAGMVIVGWLVWDGERLLGVKRWLVFLVPVFLLMDREWWRVIHMGRPEAWMLVCGLIGIRGWLGSRLGNPQTKREWLWLGVAGLGMAGALLCHTLGVVFVLAIGIDWVVSLINKSRVVELIKVVRNSLSIVVFWLLVWMPFGVWLFHDEGFFGWFFKQMEARSGLESSVWVWYVWWQTDDVILKIIYALYVALSLLVIICAWRFSREGRFWSIMLSVSWVVGLRWQHEYAMFVSVFVLYLSLVVVGVNVWKDRARYQTCLALGLASVACLGLLNFGYLVKRMVEVGGHRYEYDVFAEEILQVVPEGVTVYMSAVPDPYFALKERASNEIVHFPTLWTELDVWQGVMSEVDYVIYTHPLGGNALGGVYELEYIQEHGEEVFYVGGSEDAYGAVVVRLGETRSL